MNAYSFRTQVVGYLRAFPDLFQKDIEAKFASYSAYLDYMSRPDAWGDDLTLVAAAHLLLCRIRVISDCDLEGERIFTPPPMISSDVWRDDVYICHMLQNHFEATCPKLPQAPRAKAEV